MALNFLESKCPKAFPQKALPFFCTMQGWAGTNVFVHAFQIFSVDLIVRAVKQVLVKVGSERV